MYAYGHGVAQDYKEAIKWYRKAADQEDSDAESKLGWMYFSGEGVAQDYKEAIKWFHKAADQGDLRSQHNLGLMYFDGTGVLKDAVTAHMWFEIAGANGLKISAEGRRAIGKDMTPAQIVEARKLASEWIAKHR